MMTRKHFNMIASINHASRPAVSNPAALKSAWYMQWVQGVRAQASAFANDNPKFDRNKFFEASGVLEVRTNLMSKKEFVQEVGTPISCDPSSETYWSM